MNISTKSRYGIRALYEIAKQGRDGSPVKRRIISEQQRIPDSYLENILVVLKNAGIIRTTRGANGGCQFVRDPGTVTVLEVVELLEGSGTLFSCIQDAASCAAGETCPTRDMWMEMINAMKQVLARYTVQDLADKTEASGQLMYVI